MIQTTGGNATDKLVTRVGYGDFPANSGNGWTVFIQFKYNAPVAGGKYASIFNLFSGLTDFTDPYVFIGSSLATDDVLVEAFNGTTDITSVTQAIVIGDQNWIGISYTPSTHVIGIIVNNVFVGDFVINLSSVTFDSISLLGDGTGAAKSPISVAYCRCWSRVLMASELTTEATTILASTNTGLLWDCPLQASIDLTAHNNTLNQLTATGTVTTDTTDPLLSIIAGPPTNTLPGTALTITTDSVIFQDVNSGGTAVAETWYKVDVPADSVVFGAIAFGDLTTYKPNIFIYDSLAHANSDTRYLSLFSNPNQPVQFPVNSVTTFYFGVRRNAAVAASTLQVSILLALILPVSVGSFAVNDDKPNFPLAFLDRTTGYPIRFVNPFPAGEGASVLPSGIAAATDDDDVSGGQFLTTIDGLTTTHVVDLTDFGYDAVSDDQSSIFYTGSGDAGAHGRILSVSDAGIIGSTQYDLPNDGVSGFRALGVNKATSSIAYYVRSSIGSVPIHRFDLTNNVPLTDLTTGPASKIASKDIIVHSDDTIFILFMQATVSLSLIQYNTNGTIAQTISLGANTRTTDNRIARANEVGHLWVWNRFNTPFGFDEFLRIRISDGATVETVTNTAEYEGGIYQPAVGNTPIRFGHSESCPFWVTGTAITPVNAASGLYNLSGTGNTVRLFHDRLWIDAAAGTDESVAIPNPFTESYLAGDE